MHPARIAELLAPFLDDADNQRLTTSDLEHISTYIDILLRWSARINLTAIRHPEEIVTRHFGESLFAARVLFQVRFENRGRPGLQGRVNDENTNGAVAPTSTLADIGSGAGFPGIPIKLWRSDLALTLIESNHKKATFLREVARALTLTDIDILTARAETLNRDTFDVVTLRAVERFESILSVGANLVTPGGRLAILIGAAQRTAARSILSRTHGFETASMSTTPIPLSRARILVIAQRSKSGQAEIST